MTSAGSDSGPRIVCVLGMSRSGTSLTTRLLNLQGVYLGPEEGLLGPMPANPEGFWEHFRLMRLNERILQSMGGSWRDPPRLLPGWEASDSLAAEREEARELLETTFADRPLWGWKDPRNCLTLPFWQQLLPEIRYVICLRNPLDVAASLTRRDEIPADHGLDLWLTYVASALVNTAGRPRLLVSYEQYFDQDWRATAERLARFIGVERGTEEAGLDGAVDDRLWHHRTSTEDALSDGRLPREVGALHLVAESLRLATDDSSGEDRSELAHAADRLARRILDGQARDRAEVAPPS